MILTPSHSKLEKVIVYEVKEEVHNTLTNTWQYHFEPEDMDGWVWNQKNDRVEVNLVPFGNEFGRFWDKEEVISWSIITKWQRPS